MKYNKDGNTIMFMHEILRNVLLNELEEMPDKYGIPQEIIEKTMLTLFLKDGSKSIWKGGRTKFVKAYVEEVILLIDENEIDFDDLGFLLYLSAKFTNLEDNALRREDGEYITQSELINAIHEKKKKKTSKPTIERYLTELKAKKLIYVKNHPKDKRKNIFYLSPFLFYKGKYIDSKMKKALLDFTKGIKDEIKKRKTQEELIQENFNIEFINENDDEKLLHSVLDELAKVG